MGSQPSAATSTRMIFCCQTRSIATPAEQRRDNNSQQPALHHSKRAVVKATTKYYTLRRPRTFSQARAAPAPPPSRQQKPAASLPVTPRRLAGRHRRPWGLFPPDRRNRLTRRPTAVNRCTPACWTPSRAQRDPLWPITLALENAAPGRTTRLRAPPTSHPPLTLHSLSSGQMARTPARTHARTHVAAPAAAAAPARAH